MIIITMLLKQTRLLRISTNTVYALKSPVQWVTTNLKMRQDFMLFVWRYTLYGIVFTIFTAAAAAADAVDMGPVTLHYFPPSLCCMRSIIDNMRCLYEGIVRCMAYIQSL